MGHRRSGAQRRAIQKAALLQRQKQAAVDAAASGCAGQAVVVAPITLPSGNRRRQPARQTIRPPFPEVVAAVEDLYADRLKPFGRLLRKRLVERRSPTAKATTEQAAEVDMEHVRKLCEAASDAMEVGSEDAGDWSVVLLDRISNFVDVYSPLDVYPEKLWLCLAEHIRCDEEMSLPGGRYSCAQALRSAALPCLQGRPLGEICHIVELALSDKKLLGYKNGSVVAYSRSQSMMKESSALEARPCEVVCEEAACLPVASWDEAVQCLEQVLDEAAESQGVQCPVIALSNVKRLFRAQFQMELSETALGHAKLSQLLQDHRFRALCTVRLDSHGYTVVGKEDRPSGASEELAEMTPAGTTLSRRSAKKVSFFEDQDSPAFVDDASPHSVLDFGRTPGPFSPTPALVSQPPGTAELAENQKSYLAEMLPMYLSMLHDKDEVAEEREQRSSAMKPFRMMESLQLDMIDDPSSPVANSLLELGPSPGLFSPSPAADRVPTAAARASWFADCSSLELLPVDCPVTPQAAGSKPPSLKTPKQAGKSTLPTLSPWKDGKLNSMVLNTFIHAVGPPSTPLPGLLRRSASMGDLSDSTRSEAIEEDESSRHSSKSVSPARSPRGNNAAAVAQQQLPPPPHAALSAAFPISIGKALGTVASPVAAAVGPASAKQPARCTEATMEPYCGSGFAAMAPPLPVARRETPPGWGMVEPTGYNLWGAHGFNHCIPPLPQPAAVPGHFGGGEAAAAGFPGALSHGAYLQPIMSLRLSDILGR
eukprot:TRINITY_DN14431_c0_g1_i1.p1 TRINITY_DN14431_c0_g1~~TRINITY_DN14431_c0_g1_i1.p1  ORF type:complete len:766 (-),score=194.96 TRINITY_DN14431_c0_g1_i1:754-3051(-)